MRSINSYFESQITQAIQVADSSIDQALDNDGDSGQTDDHPEFVAPVSICDDFDAVLHLDVRLRQIFLSDHPEVPNGLSHRSASILATKAVQRGDVRTYRLAVKARHRPFCDKQMDKLMEKAVRGGHLRMCRALLADGADPRANASWLLHLAVENEHLDVVRLLLAAGASSSDRRILVLSATRRQSEITRCLLKEVYRDRESIGDEINYAMCHAAIRSHHDLVRMMLDRGAQADYSQSEALVRSATRGQTETCRLLIERGANPRDQRSACLVEAAASGFPATCRLLIEYGADHWSRGSDCIEMADRNGHYATSCALIENGAISNSACSQRLDWAIRHGRDLVVRLMLDQNDYSADVLQGWNDRLATDDDRLEQMIQRLSENAGADISQIRLQFDDIRGHVRLAWEEAMSQ